MQLVDHNKEIEVYSLFDKTLPNSEHITLAYSGGKDSTVLGILFLRWLRMRKIKGLHITILHNDTMSEIQPMESWARKFMRDFEDEVSDLGNSVEIKIAKPPMVDSFYWRALIRGYPAPTRNFRWCVDLLKTLPTDKVVKANSSEIIMTGVREFESSTRARIVQQNYGGCPLGPSKCLAYYFVKNGNGTTRKIAPLRSWTNADVWEFLRSINDFDISDLLYLYGCEETRYGCWHCTLATVQWGLHSLDSKYLYWDAVRLIYRRISDIPELRFKKNNGYSKLGALNSCARSILLHIIRIAEQSSGIKLYGLDELSYKKIKLRTILYEMDPFEAERIISEVDPKLNPKRRVPIAEIRDITNFGEQIPLICRKIVSLSENDKSRVIMKEKGLDYIYVLINELLKYLQINKRYKQQKSRVNGHS